MDGNTIFDPLVYKVYADGGNGFREIVTTPELLYVHQDDIRPGCFQVYIKACYAETDLCSPASAVEEACIAADGGPVGNGGGTGGNDDTGDSGSVGNIPPRAPVFTITIGK